jgi:Chromo (CHRromatin Organisation MOdifier) domain
MARQRGANQEIEQYLRLFVNHRQDDWAEWLPLAEFSYNNKIQASTRQTPFMLNTGRHPRLGIEPARETKMPSVEDFVKKMLSARKEAEAALHRAAEDMARYYDQNRREAVTFKIGDKVWLDGKDIRTDRPSKKLEDKRYGPYKVTEIIGPNSYKLKLPATMKVHPVFNAVKLRPYNEHTISGRQLPPPPSPVIISNQPEWEVEYIKDSRLNRGKLQFLVKWKGYPQEECTWEPEANLQNSKKCIKEFYNKHPSAPRKISATTFSRLPFKTYENFTEAPSSANLFDWTHGKHIEGNVP